MQNCELNNLDRSKVLLINKAVSDNEFKNAEFLEIESMSTILNEFLFIYTSDKNYQINTNEIVETATIDSNEISENIEKILVSED